MEFEYLRLIEEIQQKRQFRAIHGRAIRSGNTNQDLGKLGIDPHRIDEPLLVLSQNILIKDQRIFDLLKSQDQEKTMSVSMSQFVEAVQVGMN